MREPQKPTRSLKELRSAHAIEEDRGTKGDLEDGEGSRGTINEYDDYRASLIVVAKTGSRTTHHLC